MFAEFHSTVPSVAMRRVGVLQVFPSKREYHRLRELERVGSGLLSSLPHTTLAPPLSTTTPSGIQGNEVTSFGNGTSVAAPSRSTRAPIGASSAALGTPSRASGH